MAFAVIVFSRVSGTPFHLKMIAVKTFELHSPESLKPHPCFAASLEESLFGGKKFGKILERKTFEGPTFGGIEKAFADRITMTGKKLLRAVAGNKVHTHAAKRGFIFLYEQH